MNARLIWCYYNIAIRMARGMATTCIEVESVIRGYHVYKEIWTAMLGEVLTCKREADNFHDRFAVAIMKRSDVVGHVPKKISTICSLFLRSGTITCEVNGSRQYSADLHRGGLEVPCKMKFACCDQELLTKTQKLLFLALQKGDSEMPLKQLNLKRSKHLKKLQLMTPKVLCQVQ